MQVEVNRDELAALSPRLKALPTSKGPLPTHLRALSGRLELAVSHMGWHAIGEVEASVARAGAADVDYHRFMKSVRSHDDGGVLQIRAEQRAGKLTVGTATIDLLQDRVPSPRIYRPPAATPAHGDALRTVAAAALPTRPSTAKPDSRAIIVSSSWICKAIRPAAVFAKVTSPSDLPRFSVPASLARLLTYRGAGDVRFGHDDGTVTLATSLVTLVGPAGAADRRVAVTGQIDADPAEIRAACDPGRLPADDPRWEHVHMGDKLQPQNLLVGFFGVEGDMWLRGYDDGTPVWSPAGMAAPGLEGRCVASSLRWALDGADRLVSCTFNEGLAGAGVRDMAWGWLGRVFAMAEHFDSDADVWAIRTDATRP